MFNRYWYEVKVDGCDEWKSLVVMQTNGGGRYVSAHWCGSSNDYASVDDADAINQACRDCGLVMTDYRLVRQY